LFSRRRLLQFGAGAAVLGAASACGAGGSGAGAATASPVGPNSKAVEAYAAGQRRRFPNGTTVSKTLTAAATDVDLGGSTARAWVYNGAMPGPMLRANVGDRVHVRSVDRLPEPTTVHWHGLAIRNDMDGVPNVTQKPVPSGAAFDYEFIPPDPGTYWYHSHGDLQRGRGLYGALLVDDPGDPGDYDVEFTVVLADWLTNRTPKQVFDSLRGGMDMGG
jgi:FtsP/CotA-like multicopper oxidase with cupredoxin domain